MKIFRRFRKQNIFGSYKGGLISIWWYTDNGEFWDYSTSTDDAVEYSGYLQYSNRENHMTLWRKAVREHIKDRKEQEKLIAKGYKSLERGRVIYNIRAQCYEIICSEELVHNSTFRNACIDYFNLSGNRYSFEAMHHYGKQELTGNPALDEMYYEI